MLGYRLATIGLPSPGALISWGRLTMAALFWQECGGTVEQAALAAGFGSGAAFRQMLLRHTGLSASELRERGASALLSAFAAQFAHGRERQLIKD